MVFEVDVLIKYHQHRTYRAGSCSDGLCCGCCQGVSASIKRGHPERVGGIPTLVSMGRLCVDVCNSLSLTAVNGVERSKGRKV